MSGPIFAVAHVASTNGSVGSGRSAPFSMASNTAAGAAPSSWRPGRVYFLTLLEPLQVG
jgi:hypothetical protein